MPERTAFTGIIGRAAAVGIDCGAEVVNSNGHDARAFSNANGDKDERFERHGSFRLEVHTTLLGAIPKR